MEDSTLAYCLEAPNGWFLKKFSYVSVGNNIELTDTFQDGTLLFADQEQAESFKEQSGLGWMSVEEHMLPTPEPKTT